MPRWLHPEAKMSLEELGKRSLDPNAHARVKLRKYMIDNDLTAGQFSAQCAMNRRVLDDLLRGSWRSKGGYLQLHQAFAIEWATQGAVMAYEWLADPYFEARIRGSRMSWLKDFEDRCKHHVLQWSTLKQPEAVLRHKARVLSRLFNVAWGEVKTRAWHDAEVQAQKERASVKHLLAPELSPLTDDDIWVSSAHQELSHEEWFKEVVDSSLSSRGPGRPEGPEEGEEDSED